MALDYLLAALAVAGLGTLAWRGARIWIDYGRVAGSPGAPPAWTRRLGWALWGAVVPSRYWWGAHIEAMSPDAQQQLLARETQALGLTRADGERCPLCAAEIPQAWALDGEGRVTVAQGPVQCLECEFRLDSCRHCRHFLPGPPRSSFELAPSEADITSGRCGFYKQSQPVEEAAAPQMARSLQRRGYERIRAPMKIVDSMLRPDSCRAFDPHPKRIQASDLAWPGPRRVALLHLQGSASRSDARGPADRGRPAEAWSQEKWLL
jgi:hypothetical protein